MTIAITGAGIAGAAAARELASAGRDVRLFDKGRGPGGRLATRRREEVGFDHGAPAAVSTGGAFTRFLREAVAYGSAARWDTAGEVNAVVGLPGMSGLVRYALSGLDARTPFEAATLSRGRDGWMIAATGGATDGPFDAVLVTIPAPQASRLLADVRDTFAASAGEAEYRPCWTLMLAAEGATSAMDGVAADACAAEDVAVLVANGAKPGRLPDTIVAHASAEWTRAHLEDEADTVCDRLAANVTRRLGLGAPRVAMAHRWRYAQVTRVAPAGVAYDADEGLGVAGDWCLGSTVEDAYHSGLALARAVLGAR